MRFFKYLLYFLIFFSSFTYAEKKFYDPVTSNRGCLSQSAACNSFGSHQKSNEWKSYTVAFPNETSCRFTIDLKDGRKGLSYLLTLNVDTECASGSCPPAGTPVVLYFQSLTHVPLRACEQVSGGFCITEGNPNTVDGGGTYFGVKHNPKIIHRSVSDVPANSCTPLYSDTPCDSSDPYGICYVPPDDKCTRQKDGSIFCPDDAPPPQPDPGCENGATYCDRPPQGCGPDYVTGSFNGKQLCVKKGPNAPPNPDKPNDCTVANCPKPDDSYDCPVGYYATVYNGQKICVKNNPNNSDNPKDPTDNPNDPNNGGGNGNGNGSGDGNGNGNGSGDGNSNGDGTTGGGLGGAFCETSGKQLCDAISAIKDFLTDEKDLPKKEDTKVDLQQHELQQDENKVSWSAVCPVPVSQTVSIIGYSWTYSFEFTSLCTALARLANYFVFAAYLAAAFIIAGVRNG